METVTDADADAGQDRDGGKVMPADLDALVAERLCHLPARPLRA
ncbi:hypothetical protein [Burkholderia sp. BCC1644]|nr:hypothetical protein [Burkholderia sp. BCC1644]